MKAKIGRSGVRDSEFTVPSEIVLVASLLGMAIAGVLGHAGRTVTALVFLGLSLAFLMIARSRRQ